jgi:AAA15 family ATPase/GTPase
MNIIERISFHDFGDQDFNFDNLDIEFNQLNVFTGANGVGKSFLFKAAWYMAFTLQLRQVYSLMQHPEADTKFKEESEFVFDMTFFDSQDLSGAVQISDKKSEIYIYTISFQNGKIEYFNLDIKDLDTFQNGKITQVKYASKETRTFEGYERYLKQKENMGIENYSDLDDFKKFKGVYKIYDMLWYENMYKTLKHFEEDPQSFETLKEVWAMIIDGQDKPKDPTLPTADSFVAKDGHLFLKREDGSLKNISKESAGVQSFVMLTMFSGGF